MSKIIVIHKTESLYTPTLTINKQKMSEVDTSVQLKATIFSPSELSLIAPDITLGKYLEAGYRPSLRKFDEFKPVVISKGGISRYDGEFVNDATTVIGSSSVKIGGTSTICTISAGIVEDDFEAINDYRMRLDADIIVNDQEGEEEEKAILGGDLLVTNGAVYPVVQIAKGMSGPPGSEEIELGEKLYETILHSGLVSRDELKVDVGLQSIDENGNQVILRGEDVGSIKKKFSFVLNARIQVFGRTGPLFDHCYASLVKALKDTKLPDVYLNERESSMRTRGGKKNANVNIQSYDLVCDPVKYRNLKLRDDRICWSSTFGIVDLEREIDGDENMESSKTSILLADLEGDAEDSITKRISVLSNGDGHFTSITIEKGNGDRISKKSIQEALRLAELRGNDMVKHL